MSTYYIYTDGAYSRNRDLGGIAFLIIKEDKVIAEFNKTFSHTTNNRMELYAVIYALQSIKKADEIIVFSDSMYVIGCITLGWKRKKNIDLWNEFDSAFSKVDCPNIKFKHVKGHSTNIYNNRCDSLAVEATYSLRKIG